MEGVIEIRLRKQLKERRNKQRQECTGLVTYHISHESCLAAYPNAVEILSAFGTN
jgi:hypothetical protein